MDKHRIGDAPHNFGFDYHHLIRVVRACDSRDDKRRWAAIRVYTASGDYIDIDASPRRTSVRVNGQEARLTKQTTRRKGKDRP